MYFEPITKESCLSMAKNLAETDSESAQSTWYYDKSMQTKCKCFSIIVRDIPIGFFVLKDGFTIRNESLYLYWISFDPKYRNGRYAVLATYMALDYAFNVLGASVVQSEVFENNTVSMKIHMKTAKYCGTEKSVIKIPVHHFRMTKRQWNKLKGDNKCLNSIAT